jgi:zinc protease
VDDEKFFAVRDVMLIEVWKIFSAPVAPEELSKAVKQFVSATLASRKTMQGQAQDLGGNWLAANDLNFSERYLAAIKRLTPADLQRVARAYLAPENCTLYALLPTGTAPKTTSQAEAASTHAIQKFEFPNGLRLLVKAHHRLSFVQRVSGGVLAEGYPHKQSSVDMRDCCSKKGTRTARRQIAQQIETIGGTIDSYGGNNSFGVNAEVLSSDFSTGLNLLADVLLNPTFPEPALEREREVQLASIRAQKDHLLQSGSKAMRRALFGEIGYGLDALGSESSVENIQVADVKAFHQKFARPNNCVLAVYGDINSEVVREAVEKAFKNWKSSAEIEGALRPAAVSP